MNWHWKHLIFFAPFQIDGQWMFHPTFIVRVIKVITNSAEQVAKYLPRFAPRCRCASDCVLRSTWFIKEDYPSSFLSYKLTKKSSEEGWPKKINVLRTTFNSNVSNQDVICRTKSSDQHIESDYIWIIYLNILYLPDRL